MKLFLVGLALVASSFGLLSPYLQKLFIDRISRPENLGPLGGSGFFLSLTPLQLLVLSFAALLIFLLVTQTLNYLSFRESLIAQRILGQKIYDKTISLKVESLSHRPLGEVVAIYATDVPGSTFVLEQTLPQGLSTFLPLLLAPIALGMILEIPMGPTWALLGLSTAINTYMALRQSKFFRVFKLLAAQRVGLVNEWVAHLKGLRILGWIEAFEDRILNLRKIETINRVSMVTNGQVMNSISSSLTFVLNILVLFTVVSQKDRLITSGELFASLWVVGVFLTRPFRQMPWFFTFAFDGWTSIQRLQNFLNIQNPESLPPPPDASKPLSNLASPEKDLVIDGMHLQLNSSQILLNNISLSVHEGEFLALCGEVGSGKSLFLLSLLKETSAQFRRLSLANRDLTQSSPEEMKRHFSLVPQESFVMSASLGQNILFDYSEDPLLESDLEAALKDSQFEYSLERTPEGLRTEIGERGLNLSGGQRQRVSLARAAFNEKSIILVDDGFSALDVHTEKRLLKSLFFGRWKDHTRILATHRLSVLPLTDRVAFLKEGRLVALGPFEELLKTCQEFREFTHSLEPSPKKDLKQELP